MLSNNANQRPSLPASGLQRVLAEAEERLASFTAAPDAGRQDAAAGLTLIAFEPAGVLKRAGTPLPYYPAASNFSSPDLAPFAASFLSDWFSIWRIRSRVTLNVRPTSSRVRGCSPPSP